jgi:hypothetical protein
VINGCPTAYIQLHELELLPTLWKVGADAFDGIKCFRFTSASEYDAELGAGLLIPHLRCKPLNNAIPDATF